ncbi:MAG: glycosyltransferase family 2 protein [Bacteroidetes bacterium]|nr:glycosyltransferase family 2 protein [Bacteroidota bacterium]
MAPLISICIPAYKRTEFLKRLLDSVAIQTFKNFEVIVTDDSPGNEVENLCNFYKKNFSISYYRNTQQLGTPENWNESIRKAKGDWIKLMHDDDWFSAKNSLQYFVDAINNNPASSFFFSAYRNIYLDENKEEPVFINSFRYKMIRKNPVTLFAKNVIGPPSVVIHKNDKQIYYDKNFKWLVDIEFYMRYIKAAKPVYINKELVNVGLGSLQVTKQVFRVKKVEIPESFYLLDKIGAAQLSNIFVYDGYWRFLRNLSVRSLRDISENGYSGEPPLVIKKIIAFQNRLPLWCLKTGPLSKFFMLVSFIIYFKKI